MIGTAPPASASWGHCEIDYPREAIVSPYPFETAQEHYEALLAETTANGGPTVYTRTNPPPDWNGRYSRAISLAFVAKRAGGTYEAPAYVAEPPQWFFTLDQSNVDDPVAAHARVSAAFRPGDALSLLRQ